MGKYELYWIFIFIFAEIFVNIHGRSWDMAVTIGKEINFFASNATMTGKLKNRDAIALNAIAYDDATRTLFLGDTKNKNTSLFSKDLDAKDGGWNTLLTNTNISAITGMIWDHQTQSLIFIDSINNSIKKFQQNSTEPVEIIKLPYQTLRGIAFDTCSRKIYWANSNKSNPTISSCDFDGTNEKTVVSSNLYEPLALTIDQLNGKLYWIDDDEGIHYKIERSDVNGKYRELLIHDKHQQPVSIAIDFEFVYWIDWVYSAIWRIPKNIKPGDMPFEWKSFFDSYLDAEPNSLIMRDNISPVDCLQRDKFRAEAEANHVKNDDNNKELITSTENGKENVKKHQMCLNGGKFVEFDETCVCKNGFTGIYCEKAICHNYCVHGECITTNDGRPHCKCSSEFRGSRCEQKVCNGFCLNDGQCSIKNGEPYCTCLNSRGVRCEDRTNLEDVCKIYCLNEKLELTGIDTSLCRCMEKNTLNTLCSTYDDKSGDKTLITIFSVIIGILGVVIVVLSFFVNKLRRRPRIKKRFIVSKNGITPLTTRPQLPSDQCEIMIENCCNMNICETPCFEPRLRAPDLRSTSKKEDKSSLLDSMDGNNSC